jgi:hypothetical protein
MSRPSIGDIAMTGAERQARYRAARMSGTPMFIPALDPAPPAGRPVAGLIELQTEYAPWLDALPG